MPLDLYTCREGEARGHHLLFQVYLHGAAENEVPYEDGCAPDLVAGSLEALAKPRQQAMGRRRSLRPATRRASDSG